MRYEVKVSEMPRFDPAKWSREEYAALKPKPVATTHVKGSTIDTARQAAREAVQAMGMPVRAINIGVDRAIHVLVYDAGRHGQLNQS